MNYRNERGIVGKWKNTPVHIVEAADYHFSDDIIQVIADDGMKMVKNGLVIGTLSASGSVAGVKPYNYVSKLYEVEEVTQPVKLPDEEWKGKRREFAIDEVSLDISIPSGYFEQYATAVNKFFEDLDK